MARSRRIGLDDLAALRWAMEPAVHPRQALVAYVVSGPDRALDRLGYELCVADLGGEVRSLQRGARAPRWSPDGDRIGFAQMDGSRWVPACRSLTGEEWKLSRPPGDTVDMRWAPDGSRLLVVTSLPSVSASPDLPYRVTSSRDWDPPQRHVAWIVEPDRDPLPVGLGDITTADWSPDGMRIAFITDKGVDRDTSIATGVWVWNKETGEPKCVVDPAVPIHALAWSPDGASIAYLASARNNSSSALHQLWVLDLASLESRRLGMGIDRSLGRPVRGDDERGIGAPILAWTPDSASVMTIVADGGRSHLSRFDIGGGSEVILSTEQCILEFSHTDAGLAYSWSDPQTPGEISWWDPVTGETQQVTRLGSQLLSDVELAPTTRISTTASDGVGVEGWLTLPADPENAPLVLQVHGGPHYAVGERFSFDAQRLAAQGMAVMRANPRGSQGYGQAFADGNLGDWGGRDLEDLIELVDEAVTTGELDGDRVAVIGESYGGFMAAWAVGSSDRFTAAVIENGIADFLSSSGGPIGPTFWHSELGGSPWTNPAIYLERSPITRLHRVTVPVLVIHCEDDATCPVDHGEAIHAGLRELGADVDFLRVPEEGHYFNVFGTLSRRRERTAALDSFLVEHLGAAMPQSESPTEETAS